ncbi:MAG TPA: 23S rRNA (adenine(2503)-C(2))-methyltransferase RlmN, partial [Phycisphaerae bacterium]|nr:23S rRNA (adenine(2503)-C(2))-methyltransferase RlmN [Phycisphaerae bacterium]
MIRSLIEMSPKEVAAYFQELSQPAFRASQVLQWVWKKSATDFSQMTNLPATLRSELAESMTVFTSSIAAESLSSDSLVKLALAMADGEVIETVMIPSSSRRTACVSTQCGCGMGCVFCASGLDGLRRNLTPGEIVEQILMLQHFTGERITNVVFMGMG